MDGHRNGLTVGNGLSTAKLPTYYVSIYRVCANVKVMFAD